MSLVFFEELMEEQIALIPPVEINKNVSRVPSFGWGDSRDLRAFLSQYREKHNPLVWSVPKESGPSDFQGLYSRQVELNLCVIESRQELLNGVRLDADKSFKKVLSPLWDAIERRFNLSPISMTEEMPTFMPIPNYVVGDNTEGQYIWDVLKVKFRVPYSNEYKPCNS